MTVVAAELGVNALERGVTVSLGLLDTVGESSAIVHLGCWLKNSWCGLFGAFRGSTSQYLQNAIRGLASRTLVLDRDLEKGLYAPVTVVLLAPVVLGGVLALCRESGQRHQFHRNN